ncbi:MAG TPA: hypothetical protein VII95_09800 [Terriglobales bacterium]|jgi:hypothetical protein
MDSLAGYIATVCASVAATYLSQFLKPKVKILYWLSHSFLYTIPANQLNPANSAQALPPAPAQQAAAGQPAQPASFLLLTHSVTIQNFGRDTADWVEIVHRRRPDFFQLYPSLNYTESTTPAGEHVLRIESVAPKEFFVIQLLSHAHQPEFLYIRSTAGHASPMPWMVVRKYPQWVYGLMWLLMLTGVGFGAYWLIKGALFVFKGLGAL